jgi:hypothetical protein
MQTKRAMLLYLPVYVVARMRSIRELIKDIVNNESGGIAIATARSGAGGSSRSSR